MKFLSIAATLVAAVSFASLTACGGGGSSASALVPSVQTCPDGSAVPVAGTASCPVVTLSGSAVLAANNADVSVSFSGTLDAASVTSTGITLVNDVAPTVPIMGVVSLTGTAANTEVRFVPTVRLAYGQSYTLSVNATDSVGRPVKLSKKFNTPVRGCAGNEIWSNPAMYVVPYQACVASVGVQTKLSSLNIRQDGSCSDIAAGPLASACKAYMANGTMVLSETSVIVPGHSALLWMVSVGLDGTSNFTLLDVTNPSSPVVIDSLNVVSVLSALATMSPELSWVTGNYLGLSVSMADGKKGLVTADANLKLVLTYL